MQIIIPMSGTGARFRQAGYKLPKPLIEIEGQPILAHVVSLFPGATDFLFICNEEHLSDPSLKMAEIIKRTCPKGRILGIPSHGRGPVHAVLAGAESIDREKPALVSYCDFGAIWDFPRFQRYIETCACDGAVIGYTGFHPHMLRHTKYGYVQTQGDRVTAIREKEPYTEVPMHELALCGAYYFRKASAMLEAFKRLLEREDLSLGGEHYVSLAYRFLLENGADVRTFLVQHFMQWGTPEDLKDYMYYSDLFRAQIKNVSRVHHKGMVAMPMAGTGRRFVEAGFAEAKPLIEVSGKPMAVQAMRDLPAAPLLRCVLRRDLTGGAPLEAALRRYLPQISVVMLDHATEGQALTALAACQGVADEAMVTIGACDNGLLYDGRRLSEVLAEPECDVIVWGARGYPPAARAATSYGWIDADAEGRIRKISVKEGLCDPSRDAIVTGAFTFKRCRDYRAAVQRMTARDARVGGEYYLDTAINDALALGLRCRVFVVDFYAGWGTPDEWRTYNYWQRCFDGWQAHPYSVSKDPDMAEGPMHCLD